MEDKKKKKDLPSFPANYVTLAQLQERWLKERERKQKEEQEGKGLKQLEEGQTSEPQKQSECDSISHEDEVGAAGEEGKNNNEWGVDKMGEVSESLLLNVEAKAEPSDTRVFSVNSSIRERDGKRRNRERREVGVERRLESNGLDEKTKGGPKWSLSEKEAGIDGGDRGEARAESNGLDWTADINPRLRVLPENGEIGKNNCRLGRYVKNRKSRGEDRADNNGLDEKDEICAKFMPFSVNGDNKAGPSRRNQESRGTSGETETGSESTELDHKAGTQPKVEVLSVNGRVKEGNGGRRRDGKKEESLGSGVETRLERNGRDQRDDIELELKALSVNEGLRKKSKKEDWRARRNKKRGQIGGESKSERNELDHPDTEPKDEVLSVNDWVKKRNGELRRNGKKKESLGSGVEAGAEGNGKDQRDDIELKLKAFTANEGLRKNDKKEDGQPRRNKKKGQIGGEGKSESSELDQKASGKPKVGVLSVNGGARKWNGKRNGEKEINQVTEVGAMPEGNEEDWRVGIEPEIIPLSVDGKISGVNEGSKKNGRKEVGKARRNQKGIKTRSETKIWSQKNELDHKADIEPKVEVFSVDDWAGKGDDGRRRNGKKEENWGSRVEAMAERNGKDHSDDVELELETVPVNEGSRKNGKKENQWVRKIQIHRQLGGESNSKSKFDQTAADEPKVGVLTASGGTRKKNGKKELNGGAEVEAMPVGNGEDQRVEMEPEFRASSVNGEIGGGNEGSEKKGWKGDGTARRNQESRRTRSETRSESTVLDQFAGTELKVHSYPAVGSDKTKSSFIRKEKEGSRRGGGTGNGNSGFRRKSSSYNCGHKEFRSNVSGRFDCRQVFNRKDSRMIWGKKEELSEG